MTIKRIHSVEVVGAQEVFFIDKQIIDRKIALIEDKSLETNSGFIESMYLCKDKDDNVLVSIEKCPTIVKYEYVEGDDEISIQVKQIVEDVREKLGVYQDELPD